LQVALIPTATAIALRAWREKERGGARPRRARRAGRRRPGGPARASSRWPRSSRKCGAWSPRGMTNREIGARLRWSVGTVKKYLQRALEKLGAVEVL